MCCNYVKGPFTVETLLLCTATIASGKNCFGTAVGAICASGEVNADTCDTM